MLLVWKIRSVIRYVNKKLSVLIKWVSVLRINDSILKFILWP